MDKIIRLDTVDDYNKLFGFETRHPLVSVVDLKDATRVPKRVTVNYGIYAVFLKDTRCGTLRYGRQKYDYQEGTVTSFAPGQVVETEMDENVKPAARGVLFHPDIIKGTSLGQEIRSYSFFSYSSNEALHLSLREREIFSDCLDKISLELDHSIDRLSKRLISRNIQLLLDYCLRFYERQFITRAEANGTVLSRFENLLDEYFENSSAQTEGLPTVRYFADKVCLSPNYFGDLVKKETGKTALEWIQNKIIDIAKEQLLIPTSSISQVAYGLGFQYPQHFTRVFKKVTGITPHEYRTKY